MTTTGRTVWLAKDAAWWRRGRIVELGEEFGADGPAVIDWLTCEAKAQNDGGWVKTGHKPISRGCFVDLVTVCPILSRAVQLGLLDEFQGTETVFTCRISGWKDDQEKPLAAARKAEQRARESSEKPVDTGDSPLGHFGTELDTAQLVPLRPEKSLTGQDSTEELPPLPPRGGRHRDHLAFDEQVRAYTRTLPVDATHPDTWHQVKAAISTGARTADSILDFFREWRPELLREEAA